MDSTTEQKLKRYPPLNELLFLCSENKYLAIQLDLVVGGWVIYRRAVERGRERERERERESVCVCVREREREKRERKKEKERN